MPVLWTKFNLFLKWTICGVFLLIVSVCEVDVDDENDVCLILKYGLYVYKFYMQTLHILNQEVWMLQAVKRQAVWESPLFI